MKLPWKRSHRRRGAGILTVLVASTLLLLLAFTVAGTSFHHLSVSNRLHHAQTARNLAEAALARAVAELMENHTKYQAPNPLTNFAPVPSLEPSATSGGFLSFDPTEVNNINSQLKRTQLLVSVNNFGTDSSLTVAGRTLPGESAYLQAVGVERGVERAMECMLYIPKYPWAVAAGGDIKIQGQSRIASVQNMADAADPSKELPGHILTNSATGTDALKLEGDQITVTGDAQSSSGANFGNNLIKGEKRLYAANAPIPDIKIESYDTSSRPDVTTYTNSAGPSEVSGFAYRDGSLNFSNGVKLKGGVLYVKGPITISGQITGEGAIISTDSVTVTNGVGQLSSNNKVAILSKGDLTVHGNSAANERLLLNGIVYSEGKVDTEYADIFGNTVSPGSGGMTLKDSNLYSLGSSTDSGKFTVADSSGDIPPDFTFSIEPILPPLPVIINGVPQMVDLQISAGINPALNPAANPTSPSPRFLDPATGEYMIRRTTDKAWGPPPTSANLGMGTWKTETMPHPVTGVLTCYEVPAPTGPPPLSKSDMLVHFGGITQAEDALDLAAVKAHALTLINQARANAVPPAAPLATLPASIDLMLNQRFSGPGLLQTVSLNGPRDASAICSGTLSGSGSTLFSVDLNSEDSLNMSQFIARAEKIRILYWREVTP